MTRETRLAKVLRWLAFGLLSAFGLLGSLIVTGEIMTDPGGQQGVLLLAVWLVPMLVACLVCLLWPKIGSWVMGAMLALITGLWAWYAIAPEAWDTFMDDHGPVIAIATLALGLPLAFLGLHEPRRAGWMLLLAGVIPTVGKALEITGSGDSGKALEITGLPEFVVSGALFLASGLMHRREARPGASPQPQSLPAALRCDPRNRWATNVMPLDGQPSRPCSLGQSLRKALCGFRPSLPGELRGSRPVRVESQAKSTEPELTAVRPHEPDTVWGARPEDRPAERRLGYAPAWASCCRGMTA
jgi:hypothetical protein